MSLDKFHQVGRRCLWPSWLWPSWFVAIIVEPPVVTLDMSTAPYVIIMMIMTCVLGAGESVRSVGDQWLLVNE